MTNKVDIVARMRAWRDAPYGSVSSLLREAEAEILRLRGEREGASQHAPAPDLADLPRRVDRRTGAELVTKYFFPVSPRSLEIWRLPLIHVNGKALVETRVLFEEARRRLERTA